MLFRSKRVSWTVKGDGEWHEYAVYPFWGEMGRIIRIRLDFARADGDAKGNRSFALDWLRIVEVDAPPELASPPAWTFPADAAALTPTGGLGARSALEGLALQAPSRDAWLESPFFSFPADDGFWIVVRLAATAGTQASLAWTAVGRTSHAEKHFAIIPDGRMRTYNVDLSGDRNWTGDICQIGRAHV
mgnify:CR=1 FL=1